VTIVRSIRPRRPSTNVGGLAPTARASGRRDRDRAERSVGVTAEIRRERARISFRIPRIKRRRCARRGSSSCGKSGDIGTTSGERQGMIGGAQPNPASASRTLRAAPVGGAVLGAAGWVGPEVTAARPSRAQDVRISTSSSSSRGRRRRSTTPRWGRAAVHPAAPSDRGAASSRRKRSARLRWRAGGDRPLWGRVRLAPLRSGRGSRTTTRSGRLQIGQKEARRSARALRRAAARHPRQRAMSPSGAAASLLAPASASMSSDPSRPRSRPGRAAAETALPRTG
jgi:hypothetical protein